MKLVKTAKIEVVTLSQLREGNEILWSNLRCKVLGIDSLSRSVTFAPVDSIEKPFEGSFMHYYRILACEEMNICIFCGREIASGDICEACRDERKEAYNDRGCWT